MKAEKNKQLNPVNKGIWLDEQEAIIITFSNGKETLKKISSEVENFHPTGGSRSESPWGPQEAISESTYLNRRKHQLKKYYHSIIDNLKEASNLYILGPAITKLNLFNEIRESKSLKFKDIEIQITDKLTSNQLRSKVRNHFEGKN